MLLDDSSVARLAVHRVGNQSRGEVLQLSDRTPAVDEAVSGLLLNGYLKGIVSDKKKYQFFHETDLKLNEIYCYSRQFFNGELDFLEVSQRIARHLYARSVHPNISAGDLFVILFDGLSDGERNVRALGVFKAEIREDFLSVVESGDVFDIRHASGINPRLIDKGALILENGPIVYAVDRQGQQAKFWLDDFLKAMRVPDAVSKSRMMASAVQQISTDIDDPMQQAQFKEACLALCEESQTVSSGQVMAVAEKFVPWEQATQAFDAAAESCGVRRDDHDTLPGAGMAKRLERTLSKYGVGHGISVLLPAGITLKNIHSSADGEGGLTLTLALRQRDVGA
ncbi:nucleoid-associated protein [Paludibacterium purpuratum]|uniref:Nucleoid associated protein NdpA n=1 Tax=Paludibacterium purpuratum TaxID=1144873 RepID=A0A4R7B9N7_9NEIS|nr:nucleoid-associated protein [Paludibacterium purpuratum]TDR80712.1 nucleoid associated protein NdpA [Paludibacterium purpuratum]